ncbi:TIR domain-containing protein [Spirosoma aerophilum]
MAILTVASNNRPSIFIGSSSEGLEVARAVKTNFDKEADVDIWDENLFALNKSTLENLINRASFYDFAIIILTPDDEAVIRGKNEVIPRDNVLFEFGLFLGAIGINRAFYIAEESVKILSDFNGISRTTYRGRDNLVAAVGNSCNTIRREMEVAEKLYRFSLLPSTSLAIGYFKNFLEKVADAFTHIDEFEVLEKNSKGDVVNRQVVQVKNRFPSITILLPQKLSDLQPAILRRRTSALKQITVNTSFRPFPFYIEGDVNEENVNFFDIPTTLLSSLETVNRIFSQDFLVRDNNLDRIQRREISNFEKTIRILVPDNIENELIKFDILK